MKFIIILAILLLALWYLSILIQEYQSVKKENLAMKMTNQSFIEYIKSGGTIDHITIYTTKKNSITNATFMGKPIKYEIKEIN